MAGVIHIRSALVPLLFLLIAAASAIASSDPFEAKLGSEILKAGPFGGNNSIEYFDLGDPHILQKRACPTPAAEFARKARYAVTDAFLLARSVVQMTVHTARREISVAKVDAFRREANAVGAATTAHPGSSAGFDYDSSGSDYDPPDDSNDDPVTITRPPSSSIIYNTLSEASVYYTEITWTYYRYWYIYVYIIVEVDVTTTTLSLTSTPSTTSSRISVSATNSAAARIKFQDMSSSLQDSASSANNQDSTPTSGTVTVTTSTPAPCATSTGETASCQSDTSAALDVTPGLWMALGAAIPFALMLLL
ncbi:hypothetical protein PHISCL_01035 [Aspergillus sclerotialis]|uniref:GPI anchored protein n=1 Tax=Aspergillus sclerotialis TaxID=2070753 RepID=A0A3A3AB71_9EURO|nr:hypothetical protein PHISCL_01035 [Aspergillus sclerotialis]